MLTAIGEVTGKELLTYTSAVFMLGGIWRDIRATRRTVNHHGRKLDNDRDVLIKITTEHNKNHGSCIEVPRVNGGK
jgi:hypothetical protein